MRTPLAVLLAAATMAVALPTARAEVAALVVTGRASSEGPNRDVAGVTLGLALELGIPSHDLSPVLPAVAPVRDLLEKARVAYDNLRFEDVIQRVDELERQLAMTGGQALTSEQTADGFLYRAFARDQRGDADGAWRDLLAAVRMAPDRILDPARYAPRVRAAYQRAVDAVREQSFDLEVAVPATCRATWNGRAVDGAIRVAPGAHYVRLDCGANAARGWRIEVDPGRTRIALDPIAVAAVEPAVVAVARRHSRGIAWIDVRTSDRGVVIGVRRVEQDAIGSETTLTWSSAERLETELRAVLKRWHGPVADVSRREDKPFYRSPWLWGAVGALVGAAIILPLSRGERTTSDVRASGDLPW